MWAAINTYCLLRSQGFTRRGAVIEIYKRLDELLTLLVAYRVHQKNMRECTRGAPQNTEE